MRAKITLVTEGPREESRKPIVAKLREEAKLPTANPVAALVRLREMVGEGHKPSDAAAYAFVVAGMLRSWLRLPDETAFAWTVSVLSQRAATSRTGRGITASEVYIESEVSAAIREVAESEASRWPALVDLLSRLRSRRRRLVEKADQDLDRKALAATALEHQGDHARRQAWSSVINSILRGEVTPDEMHDEVAARLEQIAEKEVSQ